MGLDQLSPAPEGLGVWGCMLTEIIKPEWESYLTFCSGKNDLPLPANPRAESSSPVPTELPSSVKGPLYH